MKGTGRRGGGEELVPPESQVKSAFASNVLAIMMNDDGFENMSMWHYVKMI
jgi:hypothetical protein